MGPELFVRAILIVMAAGATSGRTWFERRPATNDSLTFMQLLLESM
jgi:hypothetical protein